MARKVSKEPAAGPQGAKQGLLRPQDLQKISTSAEMAKIKEHEEQEKKQLQIQKDLHDAFMGREIRPDAKDRLNAAVKRAAEQGANEIQIFAFPATYCNDKGRRINNGEADWPASLEGFAKRAYDFFEAEMKPMGYRMRVQVLDYPGGVPGNVGVFLKW